MTGYIASWYERQPCVCHICSTTHELFCPSRLVESDPVRCRASADLLPYTVQQAQRRDGEGDRYDLEPLTELTEVCVRIVRLELVGQWWDRKGEIGQRREWVP